MAPDSNGGSEKLRIFKAILHSQVGGWIAACLVFAFVARWVSNDRNLVYQDLWRLRKEAIDELAAMKTVVEDNNRIVKENNELTREVLNKLQYVEWRDRRESTIPIK